MASSELSGDRCVEPHNDAESGGGSQTSRTFGVIGPSGRLLEVSRRRFKALIDKLGES